VYKTWTEKNCQPPQIEIDEENDCTTAWLAYAVHHAETKYPNAETYDKYAFAGMVSGVYSGLFGGFGTDDERQEKIENRLLFLTGRFQEAKITPTTKAALLLIIMEDQYFPELINKQQQHIFH
jgi:hypothetical protein